MSVALSLFINQFQPFFDLRLRSPLEDFDFVRDDDAVCFWRERDAHSMHASFAVTDDDSAVNFNLKQLFDIPSCAACRQQHKIMFSTFSYKM